MHNLDWFILISTILFIVIYGAIKTRKNRNINSFLKGDNSSNWFTIGVSPNIIDASFKALIDSLDYKLFKDNAPASK